MYRRSASLLQPTLGNWRLFALIALISVSPRSGGAGEAPGAAEDDVRAKVTKIVASIDPSSANRVWDAAFELEKLGEQASDAIAARMTEANPGAKIACAKALCAFDRFEAASKALKGLLNGKASKETSLQALSIIYDYALDETEPELSQFASAAKDPRLKLAALKALHAVGTSIEAQQQVEKELRTLLRSDDEQLGEEAALVLGEISIETGLVDSELRECLTRMEARPTPNGRFARVLLQLDRLRKYRYGQAGDQRQTPYNPVLIELMTRIRASHATEDPDRLSPGRLMSNAAKGMVGGLDRFSSYMTAEDYKQFGEHIGRQYAGIGAEVGFRGKDPNRVFTLIRPIYSGPSYRAGLRSYDQLIEVEGTPTGNDPKKLGDWVKQLKGEPNTQVKVKVRRHGWKEDKLFTITRGRIELPDVKYEMLPGKIGFVRLATFGKKSAAELEGALKELESKGMIGLLFDLRSNPGGLLQRAVDIADKFLKDDKLIVYSEGRDPRVARRKEFRTQDKSTHPDYPLIALINQYSASASEIVAGALKDHGRARLVGIKTYGKGSVQQIFPMESTQRQSALRLTIAKYYLPKGESIHEKGVMPDVEARPPEGIHEEFEELRISGALDKYTDEHFEEHKALLEQLAIADGKDPSRYPDFDSWYESVDHDTPKNRARRALRQWIRIKLADERGRRFVTDLAEDTQLHTAIEELAKETEDLDLKAVPEYQFLVK